MSCGLGICTEALRSDGARLFGFAEYLAALALIVVLWTIVEPRYRLRLEVAKIDIRRAAFYVIAAVGVLTLITDLWRAQGWPVIRGSLISPALWQALMAGALLFTFFAWMAVAFLWPPRFSRFNARRFVSVADGIVRKGSPDELVQLAEALGPSAERIVSAAAQDLLPQPGDKDIALNARRLLHTLEDPQFCAAVVKSAPVTLYAIFGAASAHPQAARAMSVFSHNVLSAAISVEGSFLHRENSDLYAGFASRGQQITRRVFGDCDLLDRMDGVFVDFYSYQWRPSELRAYLRAATVVLKNYASRDRPTHSITVNQIFSAVGRATSTVRLLNGSDDGQSPHAESARAILEFIEQVADALGKGGIPVADWNRVDDHDNPINRLAEISCKLIFAASSVTEPMQTSWSIQHNLVWSGVFNAHLRHGNAVMAEVHARVARMIWIQIRKLEYFPNYVGTMLLGSCLNIIGVAGNARRASVFSTRSERALFWLTRRWVVAHFDCLYRYHPDMAVAGFNPTLSYRPRSKCLRKMYEPHAGRPKPEYDTLDVEACTARTSKKNYSDFPKKWGNRKRQLSTIFPTAL
ncbi:hypothetical protein [Pseudoxanthomonas sp. PXM02]|uniref:hypothetical protein n=1 Tax=Pseudoxanthomonas sp. PXM02 TaxID=2769294 RepID=UPI001781E485|nr:hypothetical protein [Pseudoxanthomonas sp. PXM02]MBD9478504.1 hypothetical protein [Pseudoxanthomonas sp. PXM02]